MPQEKAKNKKNRVNVRHEVLQKKGLPLIEDEVSAITRWTPVGIACY